MRFGAHVALVGLLAVACGGGSESVKNGKKGKSSPIDAGILLGEEEKTGVKRDVDFMTEDGVIIRGTFQPGPSREKTTDKGDAVVLLVHQLGSSRAEWVAFEAALGETHSVLSIDMRGHGDSMYRNDGAAVDRKTFAEADWAKTVLDVRAAVVYLRDLQPPPASITLVGSSIGSSAVLLYATSDPSIDSLVLLSPGLSYKGMETLPAIKKLGDRPVLLMASEADAASAKAARQLAKGHPQASAKVFEGEGHGVTMTGPLIPTLLDFLKGAPASAGR